MKHLFLIADDEPLVRDDILFTLTRGGFDECELIEAENGEQALEAAIARRPDVLFIDIQMPRLNGLQVMEKLAAVGWRGKAVIISGYDDFHYAQQALKLGAMDYLLKPIDEEALQRVARQAVARVEEERMQAQRAEQTRRERMTLWLESAYHRALGCGRDQGSLRNSPSPDAPLMNRAIAMGLLHVGAPSGPYTREEASYHLLNVLRRLAEGVEGFAFPHHGPGNRLVALVPADKDKDAKAILFRMAEELFAITAMSKKPLGRACFAAAWGGRMDDLIALNTQCEDALCARFSLAASGILREASEARHISPFRAPTSGEMLPAFEAFKHLAENGGSPGAIGRAALMLILPPGLPPCAAHAQAMFRMAAALVVNARFAEHAQARMKLADVAPQDMLNYLDGPEEIRTFFEDLASAACADEARAGDVGDIVEKVRTWIDVGYDQPITLAEMGRRFFINQNYLSGAFKELVGVNFIDYLTERRLAEARRLLTETGESVTTIASRAGFGSPSYFQRVFKRREGVTPLEYRERASAPPHGE